MRTYLIDADQKELVIDLSRTKKINAEMIEFEFATLDNGELVKKEKVFVRKLANQYFSSFDGTRWTKLARMDSPNILHQVDKVYDMYRGYKPSGLGGAAEGELLTKMPGKIVKIFVKEGEKVEAGQTVLVLEAMKMENEIKTPTAGTVKAIHVKEGDALEEGVLMVEVEQE